MLKTPDWVVGICLSLSDSTVARVASLSLFGACIAILAHLNWKQSSSPKIQHYKWDTSVFGSVKKRWMWDSLNLLREGYSKVSQLYAARWFPVFRI